MAIDLGFFGLAGYGCDAVYGLSEDEAMQSMNVKQQADHLGRYAAAVRRFVEQLHEAGVVLVRGGQFRHLMLANTSKGIAMQMVLDRYRQREPEFEWGAVALGDSPNDWSMLERADIGILIPRMDYDANHKRFAGIRRASFPSSCGWNDAILSWLSEIKEEVECE